MRLKFQKAATREDAVQRLGAGETELLLTDGGRTKDKGGWMKDGGGNPEGGNIGSIELGRMTVGVIVHAENPLESLPLDEARSIFCGEVKKWPPVRGVAAPMHVLGLPQTSPITQLLREKLALTPALSQGERVTAAPKALRFTAQADSEKVLLAVARDSAAIGFVDIGRLPAKEKSVKLVQILTQASGKHGAHAAALSADALPEDYPLARTLTLSVSPSASRMAIDFAEFLTREHCKETIAKHNLLPPLHAFDPSQFARAAPRRNDPQVQLASADSPLPLVLDDPDAARAKPPAKIEMLAVKAEPEVLAPADTPKAPEDEAAAPRGTRANRRRQASQRRRGPQRSRGSTIQRPGSCGRCRGGRFGHRGGLAECVETEEEAALKVDQSPS